MLYSSSRVLCNIISINNCLYCLGSAAVDWLLAWYFATTRPEAITLCNSMLRNGLFHAIIEEDGKNGMVTSIAKDRQACHQFEDSESARYIFVRNTCIYMYHIPSLYGHTVKPRII